MEMTDQPLRVPEVARRLGLDGPVVYDLIATGELAAGKGEDGLVYVKESALADYERRHTATAQQLDVVADEPDLDEFASVAGYTQDAVEESAVGARDGGVVLRLMVTRRLHLLGDSLAFT